MISFTPFSSVAGQPSAQAAPSRVSSDANPSKSAQAEAPPSARATVRAQAVTSTDSSPMVRAQIEEGPGAESRRVNLSTEEFIARRRVRVRSEDRRREASSPALATPQLRAARVFESLSEETGVEDARSLQSSGSDALRVA
jgi:hypothetical protein